MNKQLYEKAQEILLHVIDKNIHHADVYYLLGETFRL